jgi:hypothetical protein
VYDTPTPPSGELFRLANATDHFYTTSATERQDAVTNFGYVYEGVACYVFPIQMPGTVPLYRLVKVTDARDVDLVKAVIASSSIPVVFPPVKLLDEWYVDGGVRDILPIQAAIDLGADQLACRCLSDEKGRVSGQRVTHSGTFPTAPPRTTHTRFPCTWLSRTLAPFLYEVF